ncbi:hypothetical protein MJ561_03595 [Klebsiella pneumoniae]|nr:hypothetical protein MJ561_03595 [Klebsiella pneumoniae]
MLLNLKDNSGGLRLYFVAFKLQMPAAPATPTWHIVRARATALLLYNLEIH